jgi:hypothetical protein
MQEFGIFGPNDDGNDRDEIDGWPIECYQDFEQKCLDRIEAAFETD